MIDASFGHYRVFKNLLSFNVSFNHLGRSNPQGAIHIGYLMFGYVGRISNRTSILFETIVTISLITHQPQLRNVICERPLM